MEEDTVHEGGSEDEDDSLGGSGNAAKKISSTKEKQEREKKKLTWSAQRNLPLPLPSPLPLSRLHRQRTKSNPIILTPIIIPPLLPLPTSLRHIPHHKPHRPFTQVMRIVLQSDRKPKPIPSLRIRRPQHIAQRHRTPTSSRRVRRCRGGRERGKRRKRNDILRQHLRRCIPLVQRKPHRHHFFVSQVSDEERAGEVHRFCGEQQAFKVDVPRS